LAKRSAPPPRKKPLEQEEEALTLAESGEREFGDVSARLEGPALPELLAYPSQPVPASKPARRPREGMPGGKEHRRTEAHEVRHEEHHSLPRQVSMPEYLPTGELLLPAPTEPGTLQEPTEQKTDLQTILADAKERGIYYRQGEPGTVLPEEVAAAVAEAARTLKALPGVESVSAGQSETGAPLILVMANRGFKASGFEQVPSEVNGVSTLVVVPYELLPLRQDRR
jgi:hypothetical protein